MMTCGRHLGSLLLATCLIGTHAHAQHALDKLLGSGGPSKPRETGQVDSSVAEKADSADDDLRRRVDDIQRTKSALMKSDTKENSRAAVDPPPVTRANEAARVKRFVCRIYCKSAAGPVILREFNAATRRDAAQQAGDAANQLCANAGHGSASSLALPESQCNSP